MDIDRKKSIIRVVKNIWFVVASVLAVCFIVLMGVSCANMNKNKNNNSNVNTNVEIVNRIQPKLVSYDDDDEYINLTAIETTYTYSNLYNYIVDNDLLGVGDMFALNYGVNTYHYDSNRSNPGIIAFSYSETADISHSLAFMIDYVDYMGGIYDDFPELLTKNYYFFSYDNDSLLDNELQLSIPLDTYYDSIKSVIELDIQAYTDIISGNGGIFHNISSAIVGFVGSLSSGITAMIGVFYNNGALTVIGLLSVIVVAISLAYFFFRLFMGLIRMRG